MESLFKQQLYYTKHDFYASARSETYQQSSLNLLRRAGSDNGGNQDHITDHYSLYSDPHFQTPCTTLLQEAGPGEISD